MTARTGTCSGCDAKYKIPETFTGTKAKCKKCGGVVMIPPIEEAAAEPAPEPAPAAPADPPAASAAAAAPAGGKKKPVVRAKRGGRAAATRGRKGAAPARRKTSRRRGADDEDEGGNKTWVWIVAGVSAVAIVVILVLMMTGGDDPKTDDVAAIDETPETVDDTPATTDDDGTDPADTEEDVPEAVEPEPVDDTPEETPPPAEVPEEIDPVVTLDPLPAIIGCDQERFDRLTECFTDGFVSQELPPWKRKKLLAEFEEADFEKIPVLLNAFNGLDLLKSDDVVVAFRVAEMWNKLTGVGFVDVPIKGDTTQEEMEANLELNVKNIYAIYNIWLKKINDVDAQRTFFSKCEKYRRKAAAKEAEDG